MSQLDRRERALQAFLEGEIDRGELRRRLGGGSDAGELEDALAPYRAVWSELERQPATRLAPDFARRTARAVLAERKASPTAELQAIPEWHVGALPAAVSVATVLAALLLAVVLFTPSSVELRGWVERLVRAAESVPSPLWGAAGSAVVLYAADRLWARNVRRTGPVG